MELPIGCQEGGLHLRLHLPTPLHFLTLTETWITPENTATLAALSTAYLFSHTPRPSRRGGGMGLLILPKWSYQGLPLEHTLKFTLWQSPFLSNSTLQCSSVNPGPYCDFFDEMDALLSCFPEDGTSPVVLGDFNIQPEKLH